MADTETKTLDLSGEEIIASHKHALEEFPSLIDNDCTGCFLSDVDGRLLRWALECNETLAVLNLESLMGMKAVAHA